MYIALAILLLAAVVWLNLYSSRVEKDGQWHRYSPHFRKVACVDGVRRTNYLRRRFIGREWQYRPETEEEAFQRVVDDVI